MSLIWGVTAQALRIAPLLLFAAHTGCDVRVDPQSAGVSPWVSDEAEGVVKECGEWMTRWTRISEDFSKHSTQFAGKDVNLWSQYQGLADVAEKLSILPGALMQIEEISSCVTQAEPRKRTAATVLTYYDYVEGQIAIRRKFLNGLRKVSGYQNVQEDCAATATLLDEFEKSLVQVRKKRWEEIQRAIGVPASTKK